MSGQGKLTWPFGTEYIGSFDNGMFNGQGELTSFDGIKYYCCNTSRYTIVIYSNIKYLI